MKTVDGCDHGVECTLPRVDVTGRHSLGAEDVGQESSEGVEHCPVDVARLVAMAHVVDVALELGCVVHGRNHRIEALNDHLALGGEGSSSRKAAFPVKLSTGTFPKVLNLG